MKRPPRALPRSFYSGRDTVEIARDLLGCVLWRRSGEAEWAAVRIVETEAYLGANDPASHARRGLRSARNESMYLAGGHLYVYFTYGMHWCANVVTQEQDIAEAVLLRAGEPVEGIDWIRSNRPRVRSELDLTSGPGRLCQALAIDRELDGASLAGRQVRLTARAAPIEEDEIAISQRVGIDNSGVAHWPLRFYLRTSRYVSRGPRGTAAIPPPG